MSTEALKAATAAREAESKKLQAIKTGTDAELRAMGINPEARNKHRKISQSKVHTLTKRIRQIEKRLPSEHEKRKAQRREDSLERLKERQGKAEEKLRKGEQLTSQEILSLDARAERDRLRREKEITITRAAITAGSPQATQTNTATFREPLRPTWMEEEEVLLTTKQKEVIEKGKKLTARQERMAERIERGKNIYRAIPGLKGDNKFQRGAREFLFILNPGTGVPAFGETLAAGVDSARYIKEYRDAFGKQSTPTTAQILSEINIQSEHIVKGRDPITGEHTPESIGAGAAIITSTGIGIYAANRGGTPTTATGKPAPEVAATAASKQKPSTRVSSRTLQFKDGELRVTTVRTPKTSEPFVRIESVEKPTLPKRVGVEGKDIVIRVPKSQPLIEITGIRNPTRAIMDSIKSRLPRYTSVTEEVLPRGRTEVQISKRGIAVRKGLPKEAQPFIEISRMALPRLKSQTVEIQVGKSKLTASRYYLETTPPTNQKMIFTPQEKPVSAPPKPRVNEFSKPSKPKARSRVSEGSGDFGDIGGVRSRGFEQIALTQSEHITPEIHTPQGTQSLPAPILTTFIGENTPPVSAPQFTRSKINVGIDYSQDVRPSQMQTPQLTPRKTPIDIVQDIKPVITPDIKPRIRSERRGGSRPKPPIIDIVQDIKPRIKSDIKPDIKPEKDIITPPILPRRIRRSAPKTTITGFNVLVRRRGKFSIVNPQPLTKMQAIQYGALRVGTTAAATFKIQKASRPATGRFTGRGILRDFTRKGSLYIEKPSRRIKSTGELQEITFKGIKSKKSKKKRFAFNFKNPFKTKKGRKLL